MSECDWVLEAIRFYRPLDFFGEYSGTSDEQLAGELIARRENSGAASYLKTFLEAKKVAAKEHEEWEFFGPEAFADMIMVSQDSNRVWWDDGEIDIFPGGEIYTKFLLDCSRISRGAFTISDVVEEWNGETLEGVAFDFGGEHWEIYPSEMYGWIDFEILNQINALIEASGYQFCTHWAGDQTTFIVALTEGEKQKFEAERNWSFFEEEDEE